MPHEGIALPLFILEEWFSWAAFASWFSEARSSSETAVELLVQDRSIDPQSASPVPQRRRCLR
jgi:hypothetical protein